MNFADANNMNPFDSTSFTTPWQKMMSRMKQKTWNQKTQMWNSSGKGRKIQSMANVCLNIYHDI